MKVSVIIPVYNRQATIAQAIRSVLCQSCQDFEIIVIDDGSQDESARIVHELQRQSNKVIYAFQKNAGPAAARNRGIAMANGEYLAFLDSDDYWRPTKLEKQLVCFEQNRDAAIVHCWVEVIGSNGRRRYHRQVYNGACFEHLLAGGNAIATSSVVIKKSALQQVGGFDESTIVAEDADLWLRIAYHYRIAGVNEILVTKQEKAANSLQRQHKLMLDNARKVVLRHLDSVADPNSRRLYLSRFYGRCLANFYEAPQAYRCFGAMIKAYPKAVLEPRTYRILAGFVKNMLIAKMKARTLLFQRALVL